jgi:hypothetical protein
MLEPTLGKLPERCARIRLTWHSELPLVSEVEFGLNRVSKLEGFVEILSTRREV